MRVAIVDDSADIRVILRLLLESDDRFDVVGEGSDGTEAVELAASLQPDLLLLDRRMPRLGGVEALPEIARVAPSTSVILFTTYTDTGTYHAALSAGALDVLEKRVDREFIDQLAGILVDHWAKADAEVEVRLGPVAASAARVWIANTRGILRAVRDHPEELDEPLPADVLDMFERFLDLWEEGSRDSDELFWTARARVSDVRRLVEWWARVDAMSDDQLEKLGIHWSPPEGEPFFHALTAATLRALEQHAATQELARRLRPQWAVDS